MTEILSRDTFKAGLIAEGTITVPAPVDDTDAVNKAWAVANTVTGPAGPPGPSGQAAGKILYLATSDASDIATYKTLLTSPSVGAEQTIVTPCTGTNTDFLIASFATDPGAIGAVDYPAGTVFRRLYAMVNAGTARFHFTAYKRNAAGVETQIRDEYSDNFTDQTVMPQEWIATVPSSGALLDTDRIVAKLYAQRITGGGGTVTVTTYFEGTAHASQVQTSISAGAQGPPGPAGPGVPAGGSTNQVLAKNSATDYDTEWVDPAVPSPVGAPDGSKLKTVSGAYTLYDPNNTLGAQASIVGNTVSGTWSTNYGSNVYDGNLTTAWVLDGYTGWIRLDLGTVKEISQIGMYHHDSAGRPGNVNILTSVNGTDFTLRGNTSSPTIGVWFDLNLAPAVSARYVRLECTSHIGNWWQLTEARVFAAAVPEYPGHILQNEGTQLAQRSKINFAGTGVDATDDAANDRTVVTISGPAITVASTAPSSPAVNDLWVDST